MLNRRLLAAVYSLTVLLGLVTLMYPAPSIEGAIGVILTYVYGTLLLVGGLGALVSVVIPNYKFEMIFLWLVAGGFMTYDIALWSLFIERVAEPLGNGPAPYGPALAIGILTLFLLAKILFLFKKNNELIKAATNNVRLD